MYRVVTMYGTDEPWWFFDGWKEDIVSVDEFDDFYKALKCYKKEWFKMAENFKEFTSKSGLQTAFWKNGDEEWCEDCVGYLQRYHSIALLEDWHAIPLEKKRSGYSKKSGELPERFCSMKTEN
ncbi:DUF1033 family protein [Lactococcus lactis]|uniref:DUF1033 family protein n=1 Tax=Lactococcus lactis TaxID=1358 RepID=A0A6M0M9T0_9LACT|nr:DUF1033 family protein [Lactococcus lactis]NEX49991.1 DUF1033 family protein [Lactococcus lactis]NEX55928.1 DUF1033 family protein [Lactococcus lactis]